MRNETKAAAAYMTGIRLGKALLAGLAAIALVSCGGGGDDDADSTCGAPPQITANNPPGVATVGIQYRFVIDSEYSCRLPFWPFWPATCVGAAGAASPVQLPAGAQLPDQWSETYTWTPAANQANTNAQFEFTNGPDRCGRRATLSWTVSVGAAPVITVISTTPANGATDIAPGSLITVVFSEAMNGSTITPETVLLEDSFGNRVAAAVSSSGRNATLDPTAQLTAFTTYRATITTGVRDLNGNALVFPHSWTFTTSTD